MEFMETVPSEDFIVLETVTVPMETVPTLPCDLVTLGQKQKRKEPLQTRPLDEDDMKLEFQIIEAEEPQAIEAKKRPRKEYRIKKERPKESKKSEKPERVDKWEKAEKIETTEKQEKIEKFDKTDKSDKQDQVDRSEKPEKAEKPDKEQSRKELPKRFAKDKCLESSKTSQSIKVEPKNDHIVPPNDQPSPIHTERRTRLSNACRNPLGKSYSCNDCDFSTDRINNIVLHVKESCPKLKRS